MCLNVISEYVREKLGVRQTRTVIKQSFLNLSNNN